MDKIVAWLDKYTNLISVILIVVITIDLLT